MGQEGKDICGKEAASQVYQQSDLNCDSMNKLLTGQSLTDGTVASVQLEFLGILGELGG